MIYLHYNIWSHRSINMYTDPKITCLLTVFLLSLSLSYLFIYIYIYIYIHTHTHLVYPLYVFTYAWWLQKLCKYLLHFYFYYIGLMSRVFANGLRDQGSIPSWVIPKTQKMVLDAALLNTQHCKIRIKGKVEQSKKGVAPSPTPQCSSYWKGSLQVTVD